MDRTRRVVRSAQAGLLANTMLAVVKILAGVVGNSYALIADGIESTTDIFSSLVVWRGLNIASRDPDEDYPFGYGKAESVSGAVVSLILLGAALGIAVQAVREISSPGGPPAPFTLAILLLVVSTKEALFRTVFRVGREADSPALQADAWHHRADVITSTAAFVGISISLVGGPAWGSADGYAALFASMVILFNGVRMLRPAVHDLMDRAPAKSLLDRVSDVARSIDGVMDTEKVLGRRVGGQFRVVLHVQAEPDLSLREAHHLGGVVRRRIVAEVPSVFDVVVHMEPFEAKHPSGESTPEE